MVELVYVSKEVNGLLFVKLCLLMYNKTKLGIEGMRWNMILQTIINPYGICYMCTRKFNCLSAVIFLVSVRVFFVSNSHEEMSSI